MVSIQHTLAVVLATVAVTAADNNNNDKQNPLVMKMADQVVTGLVAARKSDVPEAKASSECKQIMSELLKNKDISGMLNQAADLVVGGIESDGFTSFVSNALKTFSNYQDSDDFKTADSLIREKVKDLDTDKALPSVSAAIGPILKMVTPTVAAMAKADKNVANAASTGVAAAESVLNTLHLVPNKAVHTGGSNSTESGASSSSSPSSDSDSTTMSGNSSSQSASKASATKSSPQVSGAAERNAVAGIAVGGVVAAGALLL